MKRYYFTIASILVFVMGIASCSNEETKTQNQGAARPTAPIQNGEVQIGNQIWMTKNLNVSRYRNGDPIPQVTNPTQWVTLTSGAWCHYQNNTANGAVYGKLYNWYAVNDPRGLAPAVWHIPSDVEWATLVNFLGGASIAGGKMKATTLWNSPNIGATNSSAFSALPGGICNYDGPYEFIGDEGSWWSSTNDSSILAWAWVLTSETTQANRSNDSKKNGFSVRCVKD